MVIWQTPSGMSLLIWCRVMKADNKSGHSNFLHKYIAILHWSYEARLEGIRGRARDVWMKAKRSSRVNLHWLFGQEVIGLEGFSYLILWGLMAIKVIERVSWHDLRHCYASWLATSGATLGACFTIVVRAICAFIFFTSQTGSWAGGRLW